MKSMNMLFCMGLSISILLLSNSTSADGNFRCRGYGESWEAKIDGTSIELTENYLQDLAVTTRFSVTEAAASHQLKNGDEVQVLRGTEAEQGETVAVVISHPLDYTGCADLFLDWLTPYQGIIVLKDRSYFGCCRR